MARAFFIAVALLACDSPQASRPILEATTSTAVERGDDPTVVAADATSTPAAGAADPRVIVTIWTDYQCNNCRRNHDIAARILDAWPDEVQVQFRQLPIQDHPLATSAGVVALAAHRQGQFMCMNSALIRSRPSWTDLSTEQFFAYAGKSLVPSCKLDSVTFERDLRDPALAARVLSDWRLASDLAIGSTPAVMVDGFRVELWPRAGIRPALLLNAYIRGQLRAAADKPNPADRVYGHLGDADLTARLLDKESD